MGWASPQTQTDFKEMMNGIFRQAVWKTTTSTKKTLAICVPVITVELKAAGQSLAATLWERFDTKKQE